MEGLTFVGELGEGVVEVAVYLDENCVSICGCLWLSLDEWMTLRKQTDELDWVWTATKTEYEKIVLEVA